MVLVFALSAGMHMAIDAIGGIGPSRTGAFPCFLLQAMGIVMEDAAQFVYHRVFGNYGKSSTWWTRVIGYVWVWSFLATVAPLYNFPLFRYQDPVKIGVPFPVVNHAVAYLGKRLPSSSN
jgi:hypothetical protein